MHACITSAQPYTIQSTKRHSLGITSAQLHTIQSTEKGSGSTFLHITSAQPHTI